ETRGGSQYLGPATLHRPVLWARSNTSGGSTAGGWLRSSIGTTTTTSIGTTTTTTSIGTTTTTTDRGRVSLVLRATYISAIVGMNKGCLQRNDSKTG
ncbi:hypothetical protein, partial [Pseudomonas savastanoi]|uniref:hypothetical protein n=1 Tax=Pseudomonas savastanoi TaxID=29438 RepID=UPI001C80A692